MRPNCHCGNIAGYWYGPSLSEQGIVKPSVEVFLKEKAYCGVCADTDNWAEYWWNWNSSFGECTEEQLWETYQLLENPEPYKDKSKVYGDACSINDLYDRLYALEGVSWVFIEDHYNLDVSITVENGNDEQIASVLCNSLPMMCRTLGDYQVSTILAGYLMKYRIYRKMQE